MRKDFVHDVSQPLTVIANLASATRILLEKRATDVPAISADELANMVLWMEQISRQTIRIGELLVELKSDQCSAQ